MLVLSKVMQRVKDRMHRLRMLIGGGTYAEMVAKNRQKFIDLFADKRLLTVLIILVVSSHSFSISLIYFLAANSKCCLNDFVVEDWYK